MTKIKNTKKGMAKKTLSISLAVAMLATSNVPVWAAEDLFTDGAAVEAVEAPVEDVFTDATEEAVVETPVVEDNAEEAIDAQADGDFPTEDSRYIAEYENVPSGIEWDDKTEVKVRVLDTQNGKYVTNDENIKWRWCDENGEVPSDSLMAGTYDITSGATEDAFGTIDNIRFKPAVAADPSVIGKSYRLQIVNVGDDDEKGYAQASTPITVKKASVSGTVDLSTGSHPKWNFVTYTGQPVTQGPTLKDGENAFSEINWDKTPEGGWENDVIGEELTFKNNHRVLGENIIDAYNVSKKKLTSVMALDSKYYEGEVSVTFTIKQKALTEDNFAEYISITLPEKNYEYTGARIVASIEDAVVTDLLSGRVLKDALTAKTEIHISDDDGSIGEYDNVNAWLNVNAESLKNFNLTKLQSGNWGSLKPVTGTYNVIKRDLNNPASTKITLSTVVNDDLAATDKGMLLNPGDPENPGLWNNLSIIDVRTGEEIQNSLYNAGAIELTLPSDPFYVNKTGETYTATVKAKNTDLVKADAKCDFFVVAHTMERTEATKENELKTTATYTGSQITKGITEANFTEKVGQLIDVDDDRRVLSLTEYSQVPEFGENLNVGMGQIIINGVAERAGTQKVIEFEIQQREATTLNVPASVPFNEEFTKATDYNLADQTTVTAKFKDEWTNEQKTLTVPTSDYTISYRWLDENGKVSKVPVKGGYIETTVTAKEDVDSNFSNISFTGKTRLAKKEITVENVVLNKDTYTYTGKDINVDFDVMYNGEKLVRDTDYTAAVVNGKDVGEGTLVVTGKGDYEAASVRVKFNIVAAKTSDVKVKLNKDVEYDGTQKKPDASEMTITLNGVDVSADFNVSYPTSKTANINAGNGELILTPANKNFDAEGTKTFVIKPATLSNGTLKAYNTKESFVKWYNGTQADEFRFTYDGTEKEYAKTLYEAEAQTGEKVVTKNDYEIKYVDNTHGLMTFKEGNDGRAFALVVAKGNYANTSYNLTVDGTQVVKNGVYTCEDGTKIENVVKAEAFIINHLAIHKSNVTVGNGQYRGGKTVAPVVSVNYNGKTLTENVDFALDFTAYPDQNRTEVTNGKTLKVKLAAKGGYYLASDVKDEAFAWGIDKFDLANADVLVTGTNAEPVVRVFNDTVYVNPDEYTVTVEKGKVTITAKETSKNYTGSYEHELKVADLADAEVIVAPVKETGVQVTPEVTVKLGNKVLTEDVDYTVSYGENIEAGENAGSVTITAVAENADYKGFKTVNFDIIAKANLADAEVTVASVKETGAQVTPDVTVKFGNKVLEKDVDYTVTYGENIEAGEGAGSVTITAVEGSVDYKGEKTVNFDIIAKADLADAEVSAIADMEATGEQLTPVVTVKYGKTLLTEGEDYTVTYGENTEVGEGTVTITAVEGNADYKGEKTVKFNIVEPAPEVGQAMIDRVDVVNNRITVVLTGEADDAEGYDYVISTVEDYKNGRLTNGINKNQVATQTTYQYLDRGVYYAYCHAWKRDENGKKVFGEWSNIERFEINVDTPSQPVITDFTVEGNTVTVNYKGSADALGYDVVLGSTYGKVYGEKRPLQYGDKVIKNAKGFSVTFTDVEPGTYYAGLHAYNRTAADSKKVFSPWSNIKTITVE